MAARAIWKDIFKNVLEKSPIGSNLFFGFILALLEKLVELEFACPCNSTNSIFVGLFFFIPGFLSFVRMIYIRGYKCEKEVVFCCIPFIVWLALVLLDGQYFACSQTDWSGSYETVPQTAPLKWCKPDNTSEKTSGELLKKTQNWFSVSQVMGMGFVGILALVAGLYAIIQCCKQNNQDQGPNDVVGGNENQNSPLNDNNKETELSTYQA